MRSDAGRILLHSEQELRLHENGTECCFDPCVEVPCPAALAVELQRLFQISVRNGASIRLPQERGKDFSSTFVFFARLFGPADEDPLTAGSVARALALVGAGDRDLIDCR